MKNYILLFMLLQLSVLAVGQDIIMKMSGDEVPAKVTEITLSDVVYKNPDSLQGRSLTIPKKEVFMIKYANGTKEIMAPVTTALTASPEAMYERGRADAKVYYKGKGVLWGSAAATLVFPYGLVVPITASMVKPKIKPTEVPDPRLLNDQNYVMGYRKQAQKRKIGKAATGLGVGFVTITAAAFLIIAATFAGR